MLLAMAKSFPKCVYVCVCVFLCVCTSAIAKSIIANLRASFSFLLFLLFSRCVLFVLCSVFISTSP